VKPSFPAVVLLATIVSLASPTAAEAIGWRTDGTGSYPGAEAVTEWSPQKNVIWKALMPDWSNATPVVLADRVITLSEPTTVIAVSKADGRILWRTPVTYADAGAADRSDKPRTHGANGYSSCTPVVQNGTAYVLFGTGVVAAVNVADGSLQWARLIDQPQHGWGHSASPTMADGKLIVQMSKVYALDPANGRTLWTADARWRWGSPVATTVGRTPIVITPNGDVIRARDGQVLARDIGELQYATPLVEGDRVFFIERRATAVRLPDAAAEPFEVEELWSSNIRGSRHYASPLLHDGLIYAASREESFAVLDAQTGEVVHEDRVRLGGRNVNSVYPSVTLAGDHVLVSSESGQTALFKPGRSPELVTLNELDGFRGSPVFDGDRMYIRTFSALYCIGPNAD
jgi:outer membrane protein assembly factor BamB